MILKFIGTSSGKTHPDRFHSSILISNNVHSLLIDCGDGTSKALLNHNIDHHTINNILFTHYHSDHLAGLPSLLTQMIIDKRKRPLKIYTHKKLINLLYNFLYASFHFPKTFDFSIEIIDFDFENQIEIFNNLSFIARKNNHIKNKHNINIKDVEFVSSSFLFTCNNSKIIYTSDIGEKEDLYLFKDTEADVFITETTHISLNEIENSSIIQNPKKTILTHIDKTKEEQINNWNYSLSEENKKKFIIAKDGMEVKI